VADRVLDEGSLSNPRTSGGRAARGCRSLGDAWCRRGRHAADAEPVDAQPVANDWPEAGGLEQHRGDGDHSHPDQIPARREAPHDGDQLAQGEVDDGAEDRPFQRSDASDQHDEHHRDHPVRVEGERRRHVERGREAHRSSQAATGRGDHEGDEAVPPHVDADARGGDVVVPHRHQAEADPRPEQRVRAGHGGRGGDDAGGEEAEHRRAHDRGPNNPLGLSNTPVRNSRCA
jgi:hypothetical protein